MTRRHGFAVKAVRAAVAHVDDVSQVALYQCSYQRCPHPSAVRITMGTLVHLLVGLCQGCGQPLIWLGIAVLDGFRERLCRQGAGHIACPCAAHSVADQEGGCVVLLPEVEGVLILLPDRSPVGETPYLHAVRLISPRKTFRHLRRGSGDSVFLTYPARSGSCGAAGRRRRRCRSPASAAPCR